MWCIIYVGPAHDTERHSNFHRIPMSSSNICLALWILLRWWCSKWRWAWWWRRWKWLSPTSARTHGKFSTSQISQDVRTSTISNEKWVCALLFIAGGTEAWKGWIRGCWLQGKEWITTDRRDSLISFIRVSRGTLSQLYWPPLMARRI